ncbi:MAG: ammonium transporter [Mycobacteriales bacterium]
MAPAVNAGDTAWVLVCTALVLFMTPGLALFYAGMVRTKNVLTMLIQNVVCIAVVSVTWVLVGYSLAFGPDAGHGLLGTLHFAGFAHMGEPVPGLPALTVPPLAFATFQMMFAVITTALITGAIADRVRFGSFVVFASAWSVLVYAPLAHWSFAADGWLARMGALDFAGGTVVEIASGSAGLAIALVVGARRDWPHDSMRPHSLPLTMVGAGILWFGWFGFNAGSALAANGLAVQALVNTHLAGVGGLIAWIGTERLRSGHATTLGAASGAVAGLVAITPAAGYVGTLPSLAIGLVAGGTCVLAVSVKYRFGYDDSLDVFGVHGVGGVVGTLMVGLFAAPAINAAVTSRGLLLGGGGGQLARQALAVLAAGTFSFVGSYLLARLVQATIGLRVSTDEENEGLDMSLHAETAYESGSVRTFGRIGT